LHFKNRKSRNNKNLRTKRTLHNGEEKRSRKYKKRGAGVQTGRSSKLNHMRNLARSNEPESNDDDEEER
jgi:hypothetical protein